MKYKPADNNLKIFGAIYPDKIPGTDVSMLYYCIRKGDKQIKFSTGERIENKYLEKGKIIDTSKRDVIENKLKEKLKKIVDYFNDKSLKHQLLSLNEIKELYNHEERTDSSVGVFKYWENYIHSKAFVPNEIRENKKYKKYNEDITNKLIIDKTTHSKLINTYRRLKIFIDNNYKDFELNERDITNEFIDKFINVYKIENYAISTINKDISNIKSYMYWLIEKNIISHWNSRLIKFITKDEPIQITISENDINQIGNIDLNDKNEYYKTSVYLMIFGFYTGLRIGDILRLNYSEIDLNKKIFTFQSQKTGQQVKVVNCNRVSEVIQYFKDISNPKIHVNTYNNYIKQILKDCNINYEIIIKRKGGLVLSKHEVASSHMLRKSFITHSLQCGINILILGKLTGKKYNDLNKPYLEITDEHIIKVYKDVFKHCNEPIYNIGIISTESNYNNVYKLNINR